MYFAVTGCNKTIRRADLRKLVAQADPVDEERRPVNFSGINVSLFTPIDRAVEGINPCLDKLDGDWEL